MRLFNIQQSKELLFHKYQALIICFIFGLAASSFAQPIINLENFASGLDLPVSITHAGDERLFVVEQRGKIRIVMPDGDVLTEPFLDIDDRVRNLSNVGDERGLLGLVFHPDYENNGYFYVNYTNNNSDTRIVRFSVDPTDPDKADPDSEKLILAIEQPFSNHNGGDMAFGPDGYLYIGTGDGGAGGDPGNRSQDRLDLLGKMLRIDVDNGDPYAIPEDNPFAEDDFTLDEIWSIGLRNPWRFSFDRLTGDMYMGDVGQGDWEEISFEPANSPGGLNFGWRCREGLVNFNTSGCNEAYEKPVHVYESTGSVGCSVTGGYVYRGSQYPDLEGKYIYGDYCSGRIWALEQNEAGVWENEELLDFQNWTLSAFGEDAGGELYAAGLGTGRIYKIVELCSAFTVEAAVTNASCDSEADGAIELSINNGEESFNIDWSNGENTEGLSNLTSGIYTVTVAFANGCERVESFEITASSISGADFSTVALDPLCEGESTLFEGPEAPEGYSYQWLLNGNPIDGATAQDLTITEAGDYSLIFTSNNPDICDGAESDAFEVIIIPEYEVILEFANGLLSATPGFANYVWILNGTVIQGENGPTLAVNAVGDYTVEVEDEFGCGGSGEISILVSIEEVLGIDRLMIAPNPFSDHLHLEVDSREETQLQISVLSVDGQNIYQSMELVGMGYTKDIDMKNYPNGIYLLSLRNGERTLVRRVVKK